MSQDAISILFEGSLQPLLILLGCCAIERWIPIPASWHPLTFVRFLALRMANKVCRGNNPPNQQRIAGILAPTVLILPFAIITIIVMNLAVFPRFFDAIFLLAAIQYQPVRKTSKDIEAALKQEKKALAKDWLQNICLRNVNSLSAVGISKADIESQLTRFVRQYLTTLLLFLLFGGLLAFIYRLLFEFSQAWNTKLTRFAQFGQSSRLIIDILSWLPTRLAVLLLLLTGSPKKILSSWRQMTKPLTSRSLLVATFAGHLAIQLGGPIIYAGQKTRYARLGPARYPTATDLKRARFSLDLVLAILLLLTTLIYSAIFLLSGGA